MQPAERRLRVDHRALDVVNRRRVVRAARIEAVGSAEAAGVGPGEKPPGLPESEARPGGLVEQGGKQGVRGQRGPGLVGMAGVPPDAPRGRVPAGSRDVGQRTLGIAEPAPRAGGAVGVDERQPPPAVVVEPGLGVRFAVTGVGRVARDRAQAPVQIPLGAGGEARHGTAVRDGRGGDRDRIDRLEQRHDVPDGGQGIAAAISQLGVIPAQAMVAPGMLGPRHTRFRQGQVALLCAGQGGRALRLSRPRGEERRDDRTEDHGSEGFCGRGHLGDNPNRTRGSRCWLPYVQR